MFRPSPPFLNIGSFHQALIDVKNKTLYFFKGFSKEQILYLSKHEKCVLGYNEIIAKDDEENIDILQAMAITSGVACSKFVSVDGAKPCFRLSVYNSGGCAGIRKSLMKKKYNGVLWCVNTDNGTIIIRRNGKCCIVGNCDVGNRENRLFNP